MDNMLNSMLIGGGGNYKVISESDAILEYLIKEQSNYENLLINESFFDDNDRLVMEAKYEVLQEAVAGAIIAAIIAAIGIIIALFSKLTGTISSGVKKMNDNIKKTAEQRKKDIDKKDSIQDNKQDNSKQNFNTKGSSPIVKPENEEDRKNREKEQEEKRRQEKESRERFNRDKKEFEERERTRTDINNAIIDYNKNTFGKEKEYLNKLSSDEKNALYTKVFGEKDDSGFNGVSMIDFTFYINEHSLDFLFELVNKVSDDRDNFDFISKDDMIEIVEYLEDEEKITEELFSFTAKNHIDPKCKTIKEKMVWLYNSKRIEDETVIKNIDYYSQSDRMRDNVNKLNDSSYTVQTKFKNKLNRLKNILERLKKSYLHGDEATEKNGWTSFRNGVATINKADSEGRVDKDKDYWEKDKNVEYYGRGEKGSTNIEKFRNHVLRVEGASLKHFQTFLNAWIEAETKRISVLNKAYTIVPVEINKIIKKKKYEEYSRKYGDKFTSRVKKPSEED